MEAFNAVKRLNTKTMLLGLRVRAHEWERACDEQRWNDAFDLEDEIYANALEWIASGAENNPKAREVARFARSLGGYGDRWLFE